MLSLFSNPIQLQLDLDLRAEMFNNWKPLEIKSWTQHGEKIENSLLHHWNFEAVLVTESELFSNLDQLRNGLVLAVDDHQFLERCRLEFPVGWYKICHQNVLGIQLSKLLQFQLGKYL